MDQELLDLVYKLKDAINNDSRVKSLEEIERKMDNSLEVVSLASKKEIATDDYNFALNHFEKDSKEVGNAQKKLYLAKKELDSNLIVKEYMECYKTVKNFYNEINNILFSIINNDVCTGCKK